METVRPLQPSSFRLQPSVWVILIVILWAIAYLPNLGVRDLRQEEGRRATPAKEMAARGDWVVPTLYGEPYLNKPPGYFWMVMAAGAVRGEIGPWADRLPSALGALAGALMLLGFGRRTIDLTTRGLAGVMLLSTAAIIDKSRLGEIDAALSAVVFGAVLLFWSVAERQPEHVKFGKKSRLLGRWVGIGLLLGLAMLMKGPPGPIEFYVPVLAFAAWEKRWRLLVSPGHVLAIVLMIAPALLWVGVLMSRTGMTLGQLTHLWGHQLGVNTLPGVGRAIDATDTSNWSVRRYVEFAFQSVTMLLPWLPLAVVMLVPTVARRGGVERALWRFLAAAVVGIFLLFFLYPSARPRHMLMITYPICLLAALTLTHGIRRLDRRRLLIGGAVGLASAIVVAVGVVYLFFIPRRAAKDETARDWAALQPLVPASGPVYTMLTFADGEGNDFYNLQFHLVPRLIGVENALGLPIGKPVTVIAALPDVAGLAARGCTVTEVGRVHAKRDIAVFHVLRQ